MTYTHLTTGNASKERLGWRYWPTVYMYEFGRIIRYLLGLD
jgi:hypothetical protein